MPRKNKLTLRQELREATARVQTLQEEKRKAAGTLKRVGAELTAEMRRRDSLAGQARRAGATTEEVAADTGLTAGRVRQIAPAKSSGGGGGGASAPADPRRGVVTEVLPEEEEEEEEEPPVRAPVVQRVRPDHPAIAPAVRAAAAGQHTAVLAPSGAGKTPFRLPPDHELPSVPRLPPLSDPYSIAARVDQALQVHGGDLVAAASALMMAAIPDAMTLLDQTRAGATYDYTAHAATPPPLIRPGKRRPDLIWEARPSYTNPQTPAGTLVSVLDVNGAYLSALRSVHLPIGRLVEERQLADGPLIWDRRHSGIYLIEPRQAWPVPELPDPLGDGREAEGPLWVADSTMRLITRAYVAHRVQMPIIHMAYRSGSSENLLRKFGDCLAAARTDAIAEGDALKLFYVKKIYSKFVSTAGDSRANFEIERPDWVHCIRSQAFANLWYKAEKAYHANLTVHKMTGTDELHVAGDWESATYKFFNRDDSVTLRPVFQQGRGLSQIECKRTYAVGAERE